MTFDSDGARLVSGSDDGTVRVWTSATGECAFVYDFHAGSVRSVAVSQSGLLAVALGDADVIIIVQLGDDTFVKTIALVEPKWVRFGEHRAEVGQHVFFLSHSSRELSKLTM